MMIYEDTLTLYEDNIENKLSTGNELRKI